jgi:hypothetical protein
LLELITKEPTKKNKMGHNIKRAATGDQVQEILITLKKRLCTSGGKCNWIKHY